MTNTSELQSATVQLEKHATPAILGRYFLREEEFCGEKFDPGHKIRFALHLADHLGTDVYDGQRLAQRVRSGMVGYLEMTNIPLRNYILGITEADPSVDAVWGIVEALAGDNQLVSAAAYAAIFGE